MVKITDDSPGENLPCSHNLLGIVHQTSSAFHQSELIQQNTDKLIAVYSPGNAPVRALYSDLLRALLIRLYRAAYLNANITQQVYGLNPWNIAKAAGFKGDEPFSFSLDIALVQVIWRRRVVYWHGSAINPLSKRLL